MLRSVWLTYICRSSLRSIEERMMALQDKKRLVFDGTVDGKLANLSKLSGEDLKYLFKN